MAPTQHISDQISHRNQAIPMKRKSFNEIFNPMRKRSFEEQYGEGPIDIDFEGMALSKEPILPIPIPSDDIETACRKLEDLADVIRQGKSVAIRTGFKGTIHGSLDAEEIAMRDMTWMELKQFKAWKSGIEMPDLDWDKCRLPVTGGPRPQKTFRRRAVALNRIYNRSDLTIENARWIAMNEVYQMPLVLAVDRVVGVELDLRGGQHMLSQLEWAEIQTLRHSVAVVKTIKKKWFESIYRKMSALDENIKVIQAREEKLRAKLSYMVLS